MENNLKEYKYPIAITLVLGVIYLPDVFEYFSTNLINLLYNKYIVAFILGYVILGVIADIVTRAIVKTVWEVTTNSYKEVLLKKNRREPRDKDIPFWLHSENRKPFNWAPRLIGVLERFIYTTAIILNQYLLIGVWLAFKAIGEWSDFSSSKRNKNGIEEGTTRIRANNFLIGTGITLIFGVIGGLLFRQSLDHNFLQNLIANSYKVIK